MSDGAEPDASVLDSAEAGGKAIRGGALRTAAYVLAMLMSLLAVPFMTRHLGEARFGYYTTVSSLLFILVGLTESGLTNFGIREYSVLSGTKRDNLMRNLLGMRLALTITGILIAVAFAWLSGRPEPIVIGSAIMGLSMLLTLTQQTYAIPLNAELRLGWVSALELIKQATLSGSFLFFVWIGTGLIPFFWATVISGASMFAVTLLLLRDQAWLLPAFELPVWRSILGRVLAYAIAAAAGLVYFRLAILVLGFVADDREVGIYSAAFRVIETIGVIPWLLIWSAFPILARAAGTDRERLRNATGRVIEVSLLAGSMVGVGLMIGAPFVIEVIAGPRFDSSVLPLQIQAIGLLTTFSVSACMFTLLSLEHYRQILFANLAATATSAILTAVLGPRYGAPGAAWATLAAELVLLGGYLIALVREDRMLLPSLAAPLRLVPAVLAMLAVWWLLDLPPVAEAVLAGIVFLPVAWVSGAIPHELVAALTRRNPAPESNDHEESR